MFGIQLGSASMFVITMAAFFLERLEGMKIKEIACQGKVIGTMVSLGGALLMVLYKGPVLQNVGSSTATQMHQPENVNDPTGAHWLLGVSAFYILQATSLRKYPANMSLATWVCFVGALQSFVVTILMERKHPEAWSLGLNSRLFAPVYAHCWRNGRGYRTISSCLGKIKRAKSNDVR
ncbi:WAT1-related protein At4g08290 [Medicago truncatula]|uniref:WAT1-related protein At4g08290 n=1 Tax=Medicago truncatula TaxID=3880 RepID=UPI00196856F9|nr:WAT1-related protein At4g08290-like [Medicago truncatula]